MTTTPNAKEVHWYNEGWVWFVFSIPAISVPLGVAMIVLSLTTNNALVVDDYYIQGKTINQRIERDQFASGNGISATVTPSATGLLVIVHSENVIAPPAMLRLQWIHVTQANLDGSMQLNQQADMSYFGKWREESHALAWGQIPDTPELHYRIHLEPDNQQWRLVSETGTLHQHHTLSYRPRSNQSQKSPG